ncbi:MAG TPA: DUF1992 domain-containing protein [Candidatus Limnocylindrales bacterium]|nr:DUF1992 domain-containing protein [Candidatus Limnocylindrales bacterium]
MDDDGAREQPPAGPADSDRRRGPPAGWPAHETAMERTIREAVERGEFDELPHRGQRLPPRDERAGEWTLAFEVLRSAGMAPPWIEADKEVRRQLAARDALLEQAVRSGPLLHGTLRRRMREVVAAADRAVEHLNALAPGPAQHRPRLDLAAELAELERRLQEGR